MAGASAAPKKKKQWTSDCEYSCHFNFHIICHHLRSLSQGDLPHDLVVAWNLAVDFLHLGIWL